ncbi:MULTISPECIES: HepT-like ribonuclease domain-containing protein [Parabacteroides]|uniref:HepT-like ribonuclease domain-containing protein n=2 Tax=Parabacteroides leei TaxID=2939491 RepID=UPI0018999326|nr:HepT-like ribonuclease domain-containing protein [Parabacteroides goldsteinii]
MYNKLVVLHILQLLHDSLIQIIKRSSAIHSPDDFLLSESGVTLLDSICMKLTAIGESLKNLDKITNRQFLINYPEIPWKNVMGIRDIIVHHYFDVDALEIFRISKENVPELLSVIDKMINDLTEEN